MSVENFPCYSVAVLVVNYPPLLTLTFPSVSITSAAFASKLQAARHRMVYALLKDEMAREGGIHALQLRTRTPEEEEREKE